jgi:hypothetical protein
MRHQVKWKKVFRAWPFRRRTQVDLTGLVHIAIPDSVTVAGNRGQNGSEGPLLFTTKMAENNYPFLFGTGNKSRITGLRIKGPNPNYADYTEETKAAGYDFGARAIATRDETEVGNCEISNCGVRELRSDFLAVGRALAELFNRESHSVEEVLRNRTKTIEWAGTVKETFAAVMSIGSSLTTSASLSTSGSASRSA